MALQGYSDDRTITRSASGSIRGNTLTFGHAIGASGSTTTIERPTGGSVTQGGSGINTDSATGGVYTNEESANFGGSGGRTSSGGSQTVSNPINGVSGSTASAGYSGGGGGSVLGNADSQTAVNPQTGSRVAVSFNPLYLLLLIPLFFIKKK